MSATADIRLDDAWIRGTHLILESNEQRYVVWDYDEIKGCLTPETLFVVEQSLIEAWEKVLALPEMSEAEVPTIARD